MINGEDCIKDQVSGRFKRPDHQGKTEIGKITNKQKPGDENERKWTKVERNKRYREIKKALDEEWPTKIESENGENDGISVPSHFKKYTIQNRKIVVTQPMR